MKKRIAALCILTAVSLFGCQSKESYFDKAQSQLEKSEYEDALENYNKAIMEDDNLALSYRGAGISAFMLADYDKAEDYLLRALKESKGVVGEQEVDLSLYLAETYINKGENDKAHEYTQISDFVPQILMQEYAAEYYMQESRMQKMQRKILQRL